MTRAPLLSAIALATLFLAGSAWAMSPPAYQGLRRQVKKTSFSSAKLDVVKVAASSNVFTSAQVKGLLKAFSFSSGKLKALRILAPKITDRGNSFAILNAFTFSGDKKKAAQILKGAGSAVGGHAGHNHRGHAGQGHAAHGHARRGHAAPPGRYAQPPVRYAQPPVRYAQPRHAQPRHVQPRHVQPRRAAGPAPVARVAYPTSAGWATQAYGHYSNAWPPAAMKQLRRTLKRARFSRDKLSALKLAVGSRDDGLTAQQVIRILKAFGFSKDMVRAIRIMEPKILAMPAKDVARIIGSYPFSSDRLKVLVALKDTILDLENKYVILNAFTFSSDKRKAAKILASVKPRSPLYGTIRGRHVVFVIDCSGSMGATVFTHSGRAVNRLDYVRYELSRALRALPHGASFNLVVFAGGVLRWQPAGVVATPQNIGAAMAFMNHQRPDGGTNIWDAMKTALSEPGVDEIHFLTDGTPTAGPVRGHRQVLQNFRKLTAGHRQVPINGAALLMGNFRGDKRAQSAELVCAIAHETGGLCRVLQ